MMHATIFLMRGEEGWVALVCRNPGTVEQLTEHCNRLGFAYKTVDIELPD